MSESDDSRSRHVNRRKELRDEKKGQRQAAKEKLRKDREARESQFSVGFQSLRKSGFGFG